MNKQQTSRHLPCELTDEEKLVKGQQLGEQQAYKDRLNAEKKDFGEQMKNRLGGVETEISDLSRQLRTGKETRNVDCFWNYCDPEKDKKTLRRLDTNEILEEAAMTSDDRQLWIALNPDELAKDIDDHLEEKEADKDGEEAPEA